MTRRRPVQIVGGLLAAGLALALPACGTPGRPVSTGSSSGPIAIGSMYPLSGPQGIGGREEARGVDLAAAWANSHGGVHGRQIRLVRASAPRADAVPKAMALIRKGGASVVVGSHGSTMSAAAAEVAARDRMLLWETGAVGDLTAGGTKGAGTSFLRLAPMGANLGRAAIDFVHDQWAPAAHAPAHLRYAVAYIDDAYGRSVGLGAVDQIKARGLTLAGTFNYDITKVDFNELARRIGAVKPDVLFVSAYVDDGVALRHATVTAHIPLLTSIGTSSSYCHPVFGQRLGVDAVGLFASDKPDADHLNPDALQPEGRDALAWASDQYRRQYHEAMTAPALSGFSAAVALFVHVLPRAASTAPVDVARAAVATKLDLGTLPNGAGLDLSPPGALDAGDNQRAASVIWEWVAPGQRAIVWPKAFATRDLLPLTPVR